MKALIFGASGQDGHYLRSLLDQRGIISVGIARGAGNGTGLIAGDVGSRTFTEDLIKSQKPDYVFHLAASSTTRHEALMENHQTICTGTLNILEGVKKFSPSAKVFIAGSGVQFRNTGKPIKESDEFAANSAYSVARIQSVYAARYFRDLGLQIYVGYLFHHESPLRRSHHVSKIIADHAHRVAAGAKDKIVLGDTSVVKEWAFAGDVVGGILSLVSQDSVYEATIGTGRGFSIAEWLDACFKCVGKDWQEYVALRGDGFVAEYQTLVSDPSTLNRMGWSASMPMEELAKMMVGVLPEKR